MGSRGASSGISDKGRKYGTEYRTLAQFGEIKVVKINDGWATTSPMETMHYGRVYATVDYNGDIKHVTFYDNYGERCKQIDVRGHKHDGLSPHVHIGFHHDEICTRALTPQEQKYLDTLLTKWEHKRKKLNF